MSRSPSVSVEDDDGDIEAAIREADAVEAEPMEIDEEEVAHLFSQPGADDDGDGVGGAMFSDLSSLSDDEAGERWENKRGENVRARFFAHTLLSL
jgi:hypothetical protein